MPEQRLARARQGYEGYVYEPPRPDDAFDAYMSAPDGFRPDGGWRAHRNLHQLSTDVVRTDAETI